MKTLLRRIQRLESRAGDTSRIRLRFGELRRLPEDYQGERHVVMAGRLPHRGDREWFQYEEVPGPGPVRSNRGRIPEYIDVLFVAPFQKLSP